jgi:exodeoxyribonuclease-1
VGGDDSRSVIVAAVTDLSFFWHDYETFGRVPRRDRPAQFAGVRTDLELNEIEPPQALYCQPPTDLLPDPESCLLTGITPQQCQAQGVPENDFAGAVEACLARPGTIGCGYNSVRFDDEVTRHLFWRNLIDPYSREWRNDCSRWDLLDVVRCAWALRPEGIEWPVHDDGRASFRLEHLSAANGLAHASAHDALSDVRATLALARLVRMRKRSLWDFCLKLRHKAAVQEQIVPGRPLLHVSGRYPVERGCLAVVWPFAPHPVNKNEVIVWDLREDPAVLMSMDAQAIRARLFVRAEDLADGAQRLPIKTIHVNKSPIVIRNLDTLGVAQAERWGVDRALADRHAQTAARITGAMLGVWDGVFARAAPGEPPDVDEDLYGGFVGDEDRRTLERLRAAPPQELARRRPAFRDARLDELVFRWRARNFPATLDEADRARWEEHRRARLHEGAGGATTLAAFQDRIDTLGETADERGQGILGALVDWAERIAPEG